ncbi:cysteine protease [Salinibacterium xinjiangense]|uniref:Transglutaminase-like superfamily protein n=1 Tax=Salinibacterium xinjiangense TaxID=386302 RepID=A0A2C8ZKU1_9MICO|nr:transglutaminase domain-containing protein [Salinibacterium xinjiangense]GGK88030.1 cysteine protease [Salinibacterium xinjiangense]SOE65449.1 Transglutaminase-like superfamily protein [Salinibacterium xinjiangense]
MSRGQRNSRGFSPASPLFIAVNVAMFWVSTGIAATALWPIYRSTAIVILVGSALGFGTIIAVIGAYFRWPSPVVMVATVAAFLLVGVPLAVPAKTQYGVLPTAGGLVDLVTGVALGWKQLLTITLPVADYQALLVPALVLILTTTVVGLSVALRSTRGEIAAAFPVLVFLVATAFGPKFPDRPLVTPIALLVAVLLWLVWLRWYRRRTAVNSLLAQSTDAASLDRSPDAGVAGLRTAVSAAVILAVASTAAIGAVALVPPAADRTVLRTAIVQPFDPRDYVSPLSAFRSYWQPATIDSTLFQVRGLPEGGRIRLATLDTYNGVVYSVGSSRVTSQSGSFTRVPSTFDQSAVDGTAQELEVTIRGYSGVWLPTTGLFEAVDFTSADAATLRDGFYYNNVSGTAAVVGGLVSGDSYTLSAITPRQPTESELATLDPGSASVPIPQDVPDQLTATLEGYTSGVSGAGNRLVAALAGLKADGYISHGIGVDEPASRSGHAADRISQLFTDSRMIGDAEQYAVSAALMAKDLGFPSRVVMGFLAKGEAVTGADVSAWIEINTAQFGWVTIDPNPLVRDIPEEIPEETSQIARPQTIVPPPVLEPDRFDRQLTPDTEQQRTPDVNLALQAVLAVLRVLGWVAIAAAVVLAPFLVIVAAKFRRRKLRRNASTPIQRISGGWQEFENAVVDHGLSPEVASTRTEFAMAAGGVQSAVLAAIADRAIFAPDAPSGTDADNVWRAVDELQASLDDGLTRWQRIKARISLRSLGGYSFKNFFSR